MYLNFHFILLGIYWEILCLSQGSSIRHHLVGGLEYTLQMKGGEAMQISAGKKKKTSLQFKVSVASLNSWVLAEAWTSINNVGFDEGEWICHGLSGKVLLKHLQLWL